MTRLQHLTEKNPNMTVNILTSWTTNDKAATSDWKHTSMTVNILTSWITNDKAATSDWKHTNMSVNILTSWTTNDKGDKPSQGATSWLQRHQHVIQHLKIMNNKHQPSH